MRYSAKVYVMDVMEEIVVSGYVFDTDDQDPNDHNPWLFSVSVPGRGESDPREWLIGALYQALVKQLGPLSRVIEEGPAVGGGHTLSETGGL